MKSEVWTINKILSWTTEHFQSKGIESSRLDAEILLANALNCKRLDLYLRQDQPLTESELSEFKLRVRRRALREPVAYITGIKEFYGRPFKVNSNVLIPRPETELIVEESKSWTLGLEGIKGLDFGTGSGCLALTLCLELPQSQWRALDVSEAALEVAKQNASELSVSDRVSFVLADAASWGSDGETYDLIVANPPYIGKREEAELMVDVKCFEPAQALFSGETGTEFLRPWIFNAKRLLKPQGLLLMEIGSGQGQEAKALALEAGFKDASILQDLAGHQRILRATDLNSQ